MAPNSHPGGGQWVKCRTWLRAHPGTATSNRIPVHLVPSYGYAFNNDISSKAAFTEYNHLIRGNANMLALKKYTRTAETSLPIEKPDLDFATGLKALLRCIR
ncbi:uncharacterized protein CLUP02_07954 [Colletotrichum lupini]|uniref:Uncharacterized protein n=1 Tax=Colletotrichum lupini TaxID=145971 RepID=A0A9Q8STE4_9PEZI|nr:uncharacterized protein CLUP02_07954 [Colletotrichum lupini]UQC82466.1 hypothetical protein CLUP02_07954 [Colletotrichum lupini]